MAYEDEIKQKIQEEYEKFKNTKLKIALVGQPGAGKSSLINCILGEEIFKVSPETDTTQKAEEHEYKNLIITDLPGYGTNMFPVEQWEQEFHVGDYDLYLFVFSGKLHDSDGKLFEMMEKWRKERQHAYLIVRNKADGIWENGKTEEELREIICDDVREKSGLSMTKVYFTSCRTGEGIDELKKDIENCKLDEVKKGKFINAFKARTIADLNRKKQQCLSDVDTYALAAAANGVNPIPGVDAAIDIGIVYNMFGDIRDVFHIDSKKADRYVQIFGPLAKDVLGFVSKDEIIKFLEKYAVKYVGKTGAKYFPIIGQAISVGISYFMVEKVGQMYVDNCYNLAKGILERNIEI